MISWTLSKVVLLLHCIQCSYGFFDPCKAFGICISIQPEANRRVNNAAPLNFRKLDDKWIAPSDYQSEFAYYFPENIFTGYDWFDAKKFCEFNGGYLAEPKRREDAEFLRSYARSMGINNWWLGLREKQPCRCQFPSSNQYTNAVELNPSEIVNQALLHISCPSNTRKVCDGLASRWVWSTSQAPLLGYTNWGPSEPHHNEYCVILWHKRDFQWSDFSCNYRIDTDNSKYKPLCQKSLAPPATTTTTTKSPIDDYDSYDTDYEDGIDTNEEENEYDTENENDFSKGDVLPNSKSCFDNNAVYRGKNMRKPIKNVFSSKRCSEICHSIEGCNFWVWRGEISPPKCVLKSRLRRRRFRIQKRGAVSGKKDGCPVNSNTNIPSCSVNYDVKVDNVETIGNFFGISTPEECRDKCLGMSNICKTWTWIRLHRREKNSRRGTKCVLSAVSSEAEGFFVYKKGAVTGIYPTKDCYEQLEKSEKCACKSFMDDYYDGGNDEDYDDNYDFGGSGRIANSGEVSELSPSSSSCRRKKEYKNCLLQSVESSTPEAKLDKLTQEEVCLEYGVSFNGGATYSMIAGITSAEQCRSQCTGVCKYWTWKSKLNSCLLKSSNTYYPEAKADSVSGSNLGSCSPSESPFSSLTRCDCLAVDPEYDYSEYDYEKTDQEDSSYEDLEDKDDPFLSLITVKEGGNDCSDNLVKKCGPRQPEEIDIGQLGGSSRIFFS